ncbi:MAG TPA: cytochrome aa3 quinol oxidase subunit II [Bacillales bacterium]|nr:cytochrome aa3 quinol oxidase subunit II [Bacillales bacterium]
MKKFRLMPLASLAALMVLLSGCNGLTVLNPQGPAAESEAWLIWWAIGFMLFIVIGVFVSFGIILFRYRERPNHPRHDPEQEGNKLLEFVWTAIPVIIVICLAVPTVKTIFSVEHPAAQSDQKPMTIRVVSSQWKWIFVYPKQHIETVNYVNIPANRPVKFKLTSAKAMTSFWVPQLGGQKYAMSGMMTNLILEADHPGTYQGKNTNFNGKHYTEMKFKVHAQTKQDFKHWVHQVQQNAPKLTEKKFIDILQPTIVDPMTFSSTHLQWVNIVKNSGYAVKHTNRVPKD